MHGKESLHARLRLFVLMVALGSAACRPTAVPTPQPVVRAPRVVPEPASTTVTGGAPFTLARTSNIVVDAGNPEVAAIAEMLKRRLTHIVAIVAVSSSGAIIPPCGRCRELIRQVDPANWETMVVVAANDIVRLADLLPHAEPVRKA